MKGAVIIGPSAWLAHANLGFGLLVYALFIPESPTPVCLVWGIGHGRPTAPGNPQLSRFQVFGSYVPPWARRCGARTRVNEELLKQYDVIVSAMGTEEGGLAFMRATGYSVDRLSGLWVKRARRLPAKRGGA